jgi:hypothetical protein
MTRTLACLPLCGAALLSAAGCTEDKPVPAPPAPKESAAPATTASTKSVSAVLSAVPTASTPAPVIGAAPLCAVSGLKVWGKGANKTTGLTSVPLPDGRVAVGLAFGLQPHVLVISKTGDGKLLKVPAKEGTPLAKVPKLPEGERHLMRVTPVSVDGDKVQAFVDYRDEYKNKHRRVACGPAEGSDSWISFDGVPLLDQDPQPVGDALADLFKKKDVDGDDGYHELRDCRTFADLAKKETWIVGSELRATRKDDGTTIWRASLVIDRGPTTHEKHIHELDLRGNPPQITNFEVPMLDDLHSGGYVLTARYGGTLMAALLNDDKSVRGNMQIYPGYPTRPDVASDGDDTIISTSMTKGKGEFALKALRISGKKAELPHALTPIITDDDNIDSEMDPDFTRDSKGRRWVSYVEGLKGAGHLEIVPVDEQFRAIGKPFLITQEDDKTSEGELTELNDGAMLAVFLRDAGQGSLELVTEVLNCELPK